MSNSPLVNYTKISPNRGNTITLPNGKEKRTYARTHAIDTITIHCVVGQCSVETLGSVFAPTSRQASSNYGIGFDGRIGMYVEEKDRSWCSSSASNDNRAVTIEVASDTKHPYKVTDAAYKALINLCVDICQRNGIKELKWKADKSLIGKVDQQNMTVHRWFANKSCPGDYLYNLHGQIAAEVNKRLGVVAKPTDNANTTLEYAVGDVVTFKGTKHYASSDSNNGKSCKPGEARVTAVAKKGKHPYHLIKTTGSTSTVYGWVDAADITKVKSTITKGCKVKVNAGAKTYTGGTLASFVYSSTYTVMQINGDRAVIGKNGVVTAAVNVKNLTVVG